MWEHKDMKIEGLHHITLVAGEAQRTVDFYAGVLGLRLVKQTVNFDDPGSYHLYFGNETAEPGSLITFFEWADVPQGRPGIGGTHHFALRVPGRDGLLRWKRRLTDHSIPVEGPYDRTYFESIYFQDPDGQVVEIATDGPGFAVDESPKRLGEARLTPPAAAGDRSRVGPAETWPEPVPMITPGMRLSQGMHHVSAISGDIGRTHDFYDGVLGMRRVKQTENYDAPGMAHWYWGDEAGRPGTLITYFEWDSKTGGRVRMGRGQTHHLAFGARDEEDQLRWRERFLAAGIPVSPVMDRVYFKSIYAQDPDGHIIEVATLGPGFMVDERPEDLGTSLQLPPWLERARTRIEPALKPLVVPGLAEDAAE
jgi:glyoxalase family protein